jgi:hypothetical protein
VKLAFGDLIAVPLGSTWPVDSVEPEGKGPVGMAAGAGAAAAEELATSPDFVDQVATPFDR